MVFFLNMGNIRLGFGHIVITRTTVNTTANDTEATRRASTPLHKGTLLSEPDTHGQLCNGPLDPRTSSD